MTVIWAETAAPEVRSLAARGSIAVWPVGSTEQHGNHLVTGFDLASASEVCVRAAASMGDAVVVLPGLPFGSSDHWLPLGATLSLHSETLTRVTLDVCRSLLASGFTRLVVVNGHAGNVGPILAALPEVGEIAVELVSYWNLVDAAELAAACECDDGGIGHAGEVETSIALYLGNGLSIAHRLPASAGVALSHGVPGARTGTFARAPRPLEESPSGVYGDPGPARPELGALVIEQAAAALARHCRTLLEEDES